MAEQVEKTVLLLEVENKQAVANIERTNRALGEMPRAVKSLSREFTMADARAGRYGKTVQQTAKHGDSLAKATQKVDRALKSQGKVFDSSERAAKAYAARLKQIRDEAGTFGDVETSTRAITGAVGYVGGEAGQRFEQLANVPNELLAATEGVIRLTGELPNMVQQLNFTKQSVVALTVGAVAFAGAAIVAKDIIDNIQEGAAAAQAATVGQIAGLRQYYDFLADATSEDAKERLYQIAEQQKYNQLLLSDLNLIKAAIESGIDPATSDFSEFLAGRALKVLDSVDLISFGMDEVSQAIQETSAQSTAFTTEFGLLSGGLNDGAFAANDAKVAAEALAEQERELASIRTSKLERETQIAIRLDQMTEDQAKKRLEQIEIEKKRYNSLVLDLKLKAEGENEYAKALERTEQKLADLEAEELMIGELRFDLTKASRGLLDVNKEILNNHKESRAVVQQHADAMAALITKQDEYYEKQAEVDAKRALDATRDLEDFQLKRQRDQADHYAELAEMDAEFYRDRGQIVADAVADIAGLEVERADELRDLNRDLEGLARDHAKSMRKIARDADRDVVKAAGDLDAIALREAKIRRDDAMRDEEEQYSDEKREREDQYSERLRILERERAEIVQFQNDELRQLEQQHARERTENENAFRLELAREDQDRAIKARRQQEEFNADDAARRAHYNIVLSDAVNHNNALVSVHTQGMNAVQAVIARSYSAATGRVIASQPIQQAITQQKSYISAAAASIPKSALSTFTPQPRQSTAMVSSGAIQVNVNAGANLAQTSSEIARQVQNQLQSMLKKVF